MPRRLARSVGELTIPPPIGRALLQALAETPSARWERVADFVAALLAAC